MRFKLRLSSVSQLATDGALFYVRRYVAARGAYNRTMEWYLKGNPALGESRSEFIVARECIEGLTSIMTFFELILIEVEEMNLELPGLMEIGIKPVRINSSRLEHEYSRFRHACGHDVLNGPALERLFKRRIR